MSITPPLNMQTVNILQFLDSPQVISELFCNIVTYNRPHVRKNRKGMNDMLAIEEVLLFFSKDANAFFTDNFVCNSLVIIAAFEFSLDKKARTQKSRISEKQFCSFMEAMFLFSHLWELYLVSDDNVQDEIIFLGEFLRAKDKLGKMKGFVFLSEITDEDWASEFLRIDGSKDGEICFSEVCRYVVKTIITPKKYAMAGISQSKQTKHSDSDRRNMRRFTTMRNKTIKVIKLVSQQSFKVDGKKFAVDLAAVPPPFLRSNQLLSLSRYCNSYDYNLHSLRTVLNRMDENHDQEMNEDQIQDDDEEEEEVGNEATSVSNDETVTSRVSLFRMIRRKKSSLQLKRKNYYSSKSMCSDDLDSNGEEIEGEGRGREVVSGDTGNGMAESSSATAVPLVVPVPAAPVPAATVPVFPVSCPSALPAAADLLSPPGREPTAEAWLRPVVRTAAGTQDLTADLRNTRKRLALRPAHFEPLLVPDHAAKTATQERAAYLRLLHSTPAKRGDPLGAPKHHVKTSSSHKREETFVSKFPDASRKRSMQTAPVDTQQNSSAFDNESEASFLFVTGNRGNFDTTSLAHSNTDSNYMHVDECNMSNYGNHDLHKEEEAARTSRDVLPQNSFSILVQSDVGGSIHTSCTQQHLSFDRNTGRVPSPLAGDVSIELSAAGHDYIDDSALPDMCADQDLLQGQGQGQGQQGQDAKLSRTGEEGVDLDLDGPGAQPRFSPLDKYARQRSSSASEILARAATAERRQLHRASPLQQQSNQVHDDLALHLDDLSLLHGYDTTPKPGPSTRPGSAPASTVTLQLTVAEEDELEQKYYPPVKQLGFYVQRAKSAVHGQLGGSRRLADIPRSTYRAPPRRDTCPRTSPLYHSWMLSDGDSTLHGAGRGAMSAKKSRAIEDLRRRQKRGEVSGPPPRC